VNVGLKHWIESILGIQIYRGWFPRGMNLSFDLLRLLPQKKMVICDVGANVGQTATDLHRSHPLAMIHAFEPIPATYQLLLQNTARYPQITSHRLAIGAEEGQFDMFLYEGSLNNSLTPDSSRQSHGKVIVDVTTLDMFCSREGIDSVDLLKIDTEGHDLNVIHGARRLFGEHRVSVVVAELGFCGTNRKHVPFKAFHEEMQSLDMELFGIYDQRREFNSVQALRRADCLFISNSGSFPRLSGSPDA
jgi:FkbM family methyltransferase